MIAKSLAKQAAVARGDGRAPGAPTQPELVEEIFDAARQLKRDVYGNRIVLFAPLYVGNDCVNDCAVLRVPPLEPRGGPPHARRATRSARRSRRSSDRGHKRLILVFGEHPHYDAEFIADCVRAGLRRHASGTARSAA